MWPAGDSMAMDCVREEGFRDPPLLRGEPLAPRHVRHTFHAARRSNDLLEMDEVLHLDEHRAVRSSIDASQIHALDIGAGGTHRGRDVCVESAPIVALERETYEESLTLCFLPVDLQ